MRKKTIIYLYFLFVSFNLVHAQVPTEADRKFDSIYFVTATEIAGTDVQRAFAIADSLYIHKTNDLQGVKTLMLQASLYSQVGDPVEAILLALQAKELAVKSKDVNWQARILGFLSTQFRNMSLYEKSKSYLAEGVELSKQIKDEKRRDSFLGLVYQEWAYASIADNELDEALRHVDLAEKYFSGITDSFQKDYLKGTNYYLYARTYLFKKDYQKSIEYYNAALSLLSNNIGDIKLLTGFIHGELGAAYLALGDYPKAKEYLDMSEEIADIADAVNLKIETYTSLSEYYKSIEDYKNYSVYQEKLISTTYAFNSLQKAAIDKMIKYLDSDVEKMSKNESILLYSLGGLMIIGGGALFYTNQRKKKTTERFKQIIKELKESEHASQQLIAANEAEVAPVVIQDKREEPSNNSESTKKSINISDKKEKEIFDGLKEFERSNGFIDRNISLATLAGQINTNTIYLSHILNNVYEKDFNLYINELRIKYAMLKLTTDKKYRTYKISYLAEEFGFSSHSKFSSVFKAITGLTPSVFINHLEKEEQVQEA
ncbi:MAG TPA: tetratricopeptide repeat protein [Flavobacterium sp.]|nr:tetratricopeptide repeat protein [Flavobacterium sp.]